MTRNSRTCIVGLVLAVVVAGAACRNQRKKAAEDTSPLDRVGPSPVGTSEAVLHKDFTVRTSVSFPFQIPAHAAIPHLHGGYIAYTGKIGIHSGEDNTTIDFLVLTEEQYSDFVGDGGSSAALFTADASHEQRVDVTLPPSLSEPKKYYLVFRNTAGENSRKVVQADLSVDF
jgi:hypothetical protein